MPLLAGHKVGSHRLATYLQVEHKLRRPVLCPEAHITAAASPHDRTARGTATAAAATASSSCWLAA